MAIVLSLIPQVVLSIVSGLDADDWRKQIVKRLLSLEELMFIFRKKKKNLRSIVLEIQRENTLLKKIYSVSGTFRKCYTFFFRQLI